MDLGRSIDPKGDPKSVENAHCKAFRTASDTQRNRLQIYNKLKDYQPAARTI